MSKIMTSLWCHVNTIVKLSVKSLFRAMILTFMGCVVVDPASPVSSQHVAVTPLYDVMTSPRRAASRRA